MQTDLSGRSASTAPTVADSSPRLGVHAVVVGGSMAGLLAARVLADHFDRVTVLDRDRFPDQPTHRRGVPQSHHAHALLPRGQQILGRLFPGLTANLLADGALPIRRPPVFITPAGRLAPPAAPQTDRSVPAAPGIYASRVLLEWHVRQELGKHPTITLRNGIEVVGLVAGDGGAVVGVRAQSRGETTADAGGEEMLLADLVIDASGRFSAAPDWLTALGYPPPPTETVHSDIGYASRFYRRPSDWPGEWDALIINGRPPHNPRAGLIVPIEHGLWHVSLGGFAGHHPPTDEAGFLTWAQQLPDPMLFEAIRDAEPVSPIRGYRTPDNRLRRFDRMSRWPAGFVAIGDAVCAFNPIYGQGITVAAIGAEVLGQALARQARAPRPDFARQFQDDLNQAVAAPWMIASGEDLRWDVASSGLRPAPGSGLVRRYVEQVLRQARSDSVVSAAYLDVIGLLAPPRSLVAPRVLRPVLAAMVRKRFRLISTAIARPRHRSAAAVETPGAG